MSNPAITCHVGNPDPGWHPQTFTEACEFLDQLIVAVLDGPYIPYVISTGTPAVENQDKVWFKLGPDGQPLGQYVYYNGNWRKSYTGNPSETKFFTGDPSTYFDSTGLGIIGGDWDGWAFMNGDNGTPNWTDKFIVTAHMDESSGLPKFDAGWKTGVSGVPTETGGANHVQLGPNYIPVVARDAVVVDMFGITGGGTAERQNDGHLFGEHSDETEDLGTFDLVPAVEERDAFPFAILPPYVTAAPVMFVGYSSV